MAADLGSISVGSMVLTPDILSKTRSVLAFMEPEKELYGLDGIDFSTLSLGKQIPAYIVEESGITLETDILYFPIMSRGNWVATAIVTTDSAGMANVQISTKYAEVYEDKCVDGEVALIFDDKSAYVLTENKLVKSATAPEATSGRGQLDQYKGAIELGTVSLAAETSVGVSDTYSLQSFDNQYYLQVPCIQQDEDSKQCWAACVASILGYYGRSTSIEEVYTKMEWDIEDDQGGTIHEAATAIGEFGYTNLNWYMYGLNWYQLRTEIYFNQNPLFAGCSYGVGFGHAVVLRGFYVYTNISQVGIISYMDPDVGEYMASSVATDGDYYYVPSGTSNQYPMTGFWSVSDY